MLEIKSLKKNFVSKNKQGKNIEKTAVKDLNLTIDEGEIFGLLGPNGAGKTTTIRMLTMLTKPTAGEILYKGKDIFSDELNVKKYIGVVPQHINFDQDLTVWENMELHGRLHHIPKSQRHARIEELLNYVELQDRVNDKVKSLSGGMKRRLLIVRALMHNPKILFLDEPTVALDPQVRRRIWDLIRRLPKDGVTVVLTTHYIEEAQEMADRIGFINKGSLQLVETKDKLMRRLGGKTLLLNLAEQLVALPASLAGLGLQAAADGMSLLYPLANREQDHDLSALLAAVGQAGLRITDIHTRERSLEDIYVEFVGAQS